VKKLRCEQIRQKDPMNLNGGDFRYWIGGDNVFNIIYKRVSKLEISIRKSEINLALGCHLVGATA